MSNVILVLILVLIVLLLCAVAFVSGLVVASKHKPLHVAAHPRQDKKDLERKSREARIRQQELENFWNYNGDAQERIKYD